MMESKVGPRQDGEKTGVIGDKAEYRVAVRKQLNEEVKKIIDIEMQKAAQELIDEQKKATRQVIEEYRITINQIVQEEKEEIWSKAETFKKSILQFGL
jgi:hypothetical protein